MTGDRIVRVQLEEVATSFDFGIIETNEDKVLLYDGLSNVNYQATVQEPGKTWLSGNYFNCCVNSTVCYGITHRFQ